MKRNILSILSLVMTLFIVFPIVGLAHGGDATPGTNLVPHHDKEQNPLDETTLTILHDTHLHGNYGDADGAENIANYFGLVNRLKQEQPNTLMFANGDDVATSVLSSTFNGEHIIDAFNAAYNEGNLDVNTFGNHDFDMGPDQLLSLVEQSEFPWVTANVIDQRTGDTFGKEQGVQPYIIQEVNGVSVGITGLLTEEAPEVTSMGENAQVVNPVEAMEAVVPVMKEAGADIIVVSSHLASTTAREVAAQVDGIDVMVGDHAALANESLEVVNDTLLGFVGDEFEFLGEINLQIKDGDIVDYNFQRYSLEQEVENGLQASAAVKEVMDRYNQQLDEALNVVIGQTETELDVMKASQRVGETKIGNFVADAIKEFTGAEAALVNGGGIRADRIFPAGDLTKRDIMDALPFTNYVVEIEVTGQTLKAALENAVSQVEDGAGRFAQVSGITYSFDLDQPAGSRIIEATINGEPVEDGQTYTLATVDFLAAGGDGYEMFAGSNYLIDANSGPLLSTLVIDAVAEQQTINPQIEGRILDLTGTEYNTPDEDNEEETNEEEADPTAGDTDTGNGDEEEEDTETNEENETEKSAETTEENENAAEADTDEENEVQGARLADTATNSLNLVVIGMVVLAAGIALFVSGRRKGTLQ